MLVLYLRALQWHDRISLCKRFTSVRISEAQISWRGDLQTISCLFCPIKLKIIDL